MESLITFRENVDFAVRSMAARDFDSDGTFLREAAKIVRSDMLRGNTEDGTCNGGVPASLVALLRMIINGPSSVSKSTHSDHDEAKLIAELIFYHSVTNTKKGEAK